MKLLQQSFSVSFQYPVYFSENIFQNQNQILKEVLSADGVASQKKLFFVIDEGVSQNHPKLVDQIKNYCKHLEEVATLVSEPLIVPGGEEVKNNRTYLDKILSITNEKGIDRHSYILAIGGGAVLDMAGFACAVAHRGIRYIRIPTTVLAQNDSGVGVKNGINAFGKKNFLGSFAPPFAVINDFTFLSTLDDRDWRAGISEAVKVALIKDREFFTFLEEHATKLLERDNASMQYLIYQCAKLHLDHIASSGDPFEFGSSRPLDFGHWSAHKLEQLTNFELRHGEAVAIGMALDVTYACLKGWLKEEEWKRILALLLKLGFEIFVPELLDNENKDVHRILAGLAEFREHLGGALTIMLLREIGKGEEVHEMDQDLILRSIEVLQRSQNKTLVI
ncbi:3-dehydroquinate synthase [Fulvivirgaceae bacterium BMA10]|uniref:3-dehydroquinate synthase n=1 Tax=Splendidivirga corallicola TaxID=3051826 RepID=A0ABT8KJW2_9BACT|nr:3-dehydroquinate synthase [Fulvivirgaceae bacterium BMA10]